MKTMFIEQVHRKIEGSFYMFIQILSISRFVQSELISCFNQTFQTHSVHEVEYQSIPFKKK